MELEYKTIECTYRVLNTSAINKTEDWNDFQRDMEANGADEVNIDYENNNNVLVRCDPIYIEDLLKVIKDWMNRVGSVCKYCDGVMDFVGENTEGKCVIPNWCPSCGSIRFKRGDDINWMSPMKKDKIIICSHCKSECATNCDDAECWKCGKKLFK